MDFPSSFGFASYRIYLFIYLFIYPASLYFRHLSESTDDCNLTCIKARRSVTMTESLSNPVQEVLSHPGGGKMESRSGFA